MMIGDSVATSVTQNRIFLLIPYYNDSLTQQFLWNKEYTKRMSSQISDTFPSTPYIHSVSIIESCQYIFMHCYIASAKRRKFTHKLQCLVSTALIGLDFPSNFSENDIKFHLAFLQKRLRNRIVLQISISSLESK